MTKNTKKNPIPLWKRIRFKLIFAFLIPVVFIIVLGFVSYQKATTQIIATYRDSVDQTVSMMNQYLTLSFDTVQSNYKGYMNEDTLKQYLNGLYDNDATTLYNTPNTYEDTFIKAVTTDALLSNIYVLSDKERTISTTKTKETGLLSAYLESSQGQILSADRAKYYLFGNQSEVDAKLGTDSSKYSVRLARYFSNAPAILIIDFKPSVLDTSLSSLDGGEGSLVGFVTCDGNEYLSSRSDTAAENTFVGKSYVDEAFASEEDNGSSYVEEAGEEYLFLYSKIGARNAMICALIPQANIIGQTAVFLASLPVFLWWTPKLTAKRFRALPLLSVPVSPAHLQVSVSLLFWAPLSAAFWKLPVQPLNWQTLLLNWLAKRTRNSPLNLWAGLFPFLYSAIPAL